MWWLRSGMKIQERLYISRQSINPCHPNISIHICFWIPVTANIKGHVTILQRSCSPFAVHVLFSGKAVSGTWAPSTLFFYPPVRKCSRMAYKNVSEVKSFLHNQEPIIRSFNLPYLPSESTLSFFFFVFFSFSWSCANVSVVSREIKEHPTYLSSKNKKIPDRIDSRVQPVWMLRVMGFCYNQ